jgi:hypothetical protein
MSICQVLYMYICYNARISIPVAMTSLVSTLAFRYVLYAGCHMPRLVGRFIYVECHVLVVASLQSDQLYAYLSTSICYNARSRMPVTVYLHLYAGT